MPPRSTAITARQSSDDIDGIEETGLPNVSTAGQPPSGSAPAAQPAAQPSGGTRPAVRGLDPNQVVRPDVRGVKYVDATWSTLRSIPGDGLQWVITSTDTYQDGRTVTYILDENGQRLTRPDGSPAATGTDDQQRSIWDNLVKDARAADPNAGRHPVRSYPGTDPQSGQPAIVTEYDQGPPRYDRMTPGDAKAYNDQREREYNAALPPEQDPAYETHAERRRRAQETIDRQQRSAAEAEDRARRGRIDEQNAATRAAEAARAASADRRAEAEATRAAREEILAGRGPNGEDVRVVRGPNGEVLRYEPIQGGKTPATLPSDAPRLDLSTADTAHSSFMALLSYIDDQVRSGRLSPEKAQQIIATPHAQVTAVLSREKSQREEAGRVRDDMLAQNRDIETRRNNRAQMSATMFSQARAAADAGKVRGDLTPEYLMLQAGLNQATGAYRDVPEVDIPAVGIGRRPAPPPGAAAGAAAPVPTDAASIAAETERQMAMTRAGMQRAGVPAQASPVTAVQDASGPQPDPSTLLVSPDASGGPPTYVAPDGSQYVKQGETYVWIGRNPAEYERAKGAGAPVGQWSPPQEEGGNTMQPSVAAVGTYQQPSSLEQRAQQMLAEGYTPEEVQAATRRFLARHGFAA